MLVFVQEGWIPDSSGNDGGGWGDEAQCVVGPRLTIPRRASECGIFRLGLNRERWGYVSSRG